MDEEISADFYIWHLDIPEERNWLESHYIDLLIRLSEKKLETRYKKILDIPCGIGRHHKYLRELGYEVYGIDINENLIKIAKKKNRGYENYYSIKDIRKIDYTNEFDVVLNWFTSFGYFSDEENKMVLRKFFDALKPKGILILDFPVKWKEGYTIQDHGEYLEVIYNERLDKYTYKHRSNLYKKSASLELVKKLDLEIKDLSP